MRVLHLSALYPPHVIGGAEKSVELLAESQTEMGMTVAAACIAPEAVPRAERNGVSVYRLAHGNLFWLEDWPRHSRPARIWQKFRQQWNHDIERSFADVISDFAPDVVHTHSLLDISPLVWRAAARQRVPVVHTLRDYALVCANAAMFRRGANCPRLHAKCAAMSAVSWLMQGHVGAVAGVGRQILDRHLTMGLFDHVPEARRRVIWNAAVVKGGTASRARRSRGDPVTFGYLGRINSEKGVGTLLRACRNLPDQGWRLLIAGECAEGLEGFERMAAGLPVEFAGFVDPAAFFPQVDALVVPSIWAEPLPRTILEAYAMGVPVIGARSGGIPDLIGERRHDWLFAPDDDRQLAERMSALLHLPREDWPVQDFSAVLAETRPEVVARKYGDLYEDTLRGAAG